MSLSPLWLGMFNTGKECLAGSSVAATMYCGIELICVTNRIIHGEAKISLMFGGMRGLEGHQIPAFIQYLVFLAVQSKNKPLNPSLMVSE